MMRPDKILLIKIYKTHLCKDNCSWWCHEHADHPARLNIVATIMQRTNVEQL